VIDGYVWRQRRWTAAVTTSPFRFRRTVLVVGAEGVGQPVDSVVLDAESDLGVDICGDAEDYYRWRRSVIGPFLTDCKAAE